MIRARFKSKFKDNGGDYRPVKFPPKYPYWCSGETGNAFVIVAFADSEEQIKEYWPEAYDISCEEVDGVTYTSRFPKPKWYNEQNEIQETQEKPQV